MAFPVQYDVVDRVAIWAVERNSVSECQEAAVRSAEPPKNGWDLHFWEFLCVLLSVSMRAGATRNENPQFGVSRPARRANKEMGCDTRARAASPRDY